MRCVLCARKGSDGFVPAGDDVRCADGDACQAREQAGLPQVELPGIPELPSDRALQASLEALSWRRSPGYVGNTGVVAPHEYNVFNRGSGDVHRAMSERLKGAGSWTATYNGWQYRYVLIGGWVYWKIKNILNRRPSEGEGADSR